MSDPERMQRSRQLAHPFGVLAERDAHAVGDGAQSHMLGPLGGGDLKGLAQGGGVKRSRPDRPGRWRAGGARHERSLPPYRSSVTVRASTKSWPVSSSSSTAEAT